VAAAVCDDVAVPDLLLVPAPEGVAEGGSADGVEETERVREAVAEGGMGVAELSWAGRYTPGAFTELATLLSARGRTSLRCSASPTVLQKVRGEAKAFPALEVTFDSSPFDPLMP
jgi:hypothetical protein